MRPRRWICWPEPDRDCIVGDCVQCDSPGQPRALRRKMTRGQMLVYAARAGWYVTEDDIDAGMRRRAVV